MQPHKTKTGLTILIITGVILSVIGVAYLLIGSFVEADSIEGSVFVFRAAFCGLGALLLTAGMLCLCVEFRKRARNRRLLAAGQYILAEISEITPNYAIHVNGRHPYVVHCRYRDLYGTVHLFKSRNLFFDPAPLLQDQMVRIYVEGEDYAHYYMDIDAILPDVIRH